MGALNKAESPSQSIPADIAEVALLNIKAVCTAVSMSRGWVHAEVRAGRFPQPMRFGQRCTRWRAQDVRAWLVDRAALGASDLNSSAQLIAKAKKASAAAQAKRASKVAA